MNSPNGTAQPCIACGTRTTNVEHVCTDCTAGAKARGHLKNLSDDELLAKPKGGGSPASASRDAVSNRAIAEKVGVSEPTVRRARANEIQVRGLAATPAPSPHPPPTLEVERLKVLTVRVTPDLERALRQLAHKESKTLEAYVLGLCEEAASWATLVEAS